MDTPVFEEFDPADECDCPGCALGGRNTVNSVTGARFGVRDALVAAAASTAAGTALAVAGATAATANAATPALSAAVAAAPKPHRPGATNPTSSPSFPSSTSAVGPAAGTADDGHGPTPQGEKGPLHGAPGYPVHPAEAPTTTRADIIDRARKWVTAKVPYSTRDYWSDGYRQDCSGFVSMAWNLGANESTGSLAAFGVRITREQLQPGDILLFHNSADPLNGSHVVIFGGWANHTHTYYLAYEQTRPRTRRQVTPYAYWSSSSRYVPYRHRGLAAGDGVGRRFGRQLVPQGLLRRQGGTDEYECVAAPGARAGAGVGAGAGDAARGWCASGAARSR